MLLRLFSFSSTVWFVRGSNVFIEVSGAPEMKAVPDLNGRYITVPGEIYGRRPVYRKVEDESVETGTAGSSQDGKELWLYFIEDPEVPGQKPAMFYWCIGDVLGGDDVHACLTGAQDAMSPTMLAAQRWTIADEDKGVFVEAFGMKVEVATAKKGEGEEALQKGMELAREGETDEAQKYFDIAAASGPRNVARDAHWQLGQIYFARRNRDKAQGHFRQYFESDAENELLDRLNFHGSLNALRDRLKKEQDAAHSAPFSQIAKERLVHSLDAVRNTEKDPKWLASHFLDCHMTVMDSGGSFNYQACAYGTTWLDSFLTVLKQPEIDDVLKSKGGARVLVLGSALGYQCAWVNSLYSDSECIGIEMLPALQKKSQELFGLEGRAYFDHRNALETQKWWSKSDEAHPLLIWSNDYEWGATARQTLLTKATEEAPAGSLLVLPILASVPSGWEMLSNITVEVSWNSAMPLATLRRLKSSSGPDLERERLADVIHGQKPRKTEI